VPESVPSRVSDMVDEDDPAIVRYEPKPLVPPPPPARRGCLSVGVVLGVVLGICFGGTAVYLVLRTVLAPAVADTTEAPALPPPTFEPATAAAEAPVAEIPTQTPFVVVVTATSHPATQAPAPSPKPYYNQGEAVVLKDGIYMKLQEGFNSAGGSCGKPEPGFGVQIWVENTTEGQFLVRFNSSDFHAADNLGTQYRLVQIGVNQSGFCSDPIGVPLEYNLTNITDWTRITMQFEGQIPLDATYLLITADWISGVGPTVFRKELY